jgi:hypothetical protein
MKRDACVLQILFVAVGAARAAAALLFAVASGSILATLLFSRTATDPIAALGWSHWAGLVASLQPPVVATARPVFL